MPPPMPVPDGDRDERRACPWPAPKRNSPQAAAFASFSTTTGRPHRRRDLAPSGSSCPAEVGREAHDRPRLVDEARPRRDRPPPTGPSPELVAVPDELAATATIASTIACRTSGPGCRAGRGRASCPSTSTRPPAILVPPMSTPMVTVMAHFLRRSRVLRAGGRCARRDGRRRGRAGRGGPCAARRSRPARVVRRPSRVARPAATLGRARPVRSSSGPASGSVRGRCGQRAATPPRPRATSVPNAATAASTHRPTGVRVGLAQPGDRRGTAGRSRAGRRRPPARGAARRSAASPAPRPPGAPPPAPARLLVLAHGDAADGPAWSRSGRKLHAHDLAGVGEVERRAVDLAAPQHRRAARSPAGADRGRRRGRRPR